MSINKLKYVLQLADNALILGHRISEWCGHGPILEQDIALTNTALDHLGQARSLYQKICSRPLQSSGRRRKKRFLFFSGFSE
jgi:1,2-phenylacetyl-CoA epoxidase catalytic subunit